MTLEEASRLAEKYFATRNASLTDERIDSEYGWVFFGAKDDDDRRRSFPGYTSTECVAISRFSRRMYRVYGPSKKIVAKPPHDDQVKQFEADGRVGNPSNRTWRWLKLRFRGPCTEEDASRVATLLTANTELTNDAASRLVDDLVRSGDSSEMLKCLDEKCEEDCVSELRELSVDIHIRHSLMRILIDQSVLETPR